MTPEEAAAQMREIDSTLGVDAESAHGAADDLLTSVLKVLGYDDMVSAYEGIHKWYG